MLHAWGTGHCLGLMILKFFPKPHVAVVAGFDVYIHHCSGHDEMPLHQSDIVCRHTDFYKSRIRSTCGSYRNAESWPCQSLEVLLTLSSKPTCGCPSAAWNQLRPQQEQARILEEVRGQQKSCDFSAGVNPTPISTAHFIMQIVVMKWCWPLSCSTMASGMLFADDLGWHARSLGQHWTKDVQEHPGREEMRSNVTKDFRYGEFNMGVSINDG